MKNNKIITKVVDGVEKEIKVLYSFDDVENEKSYVIYTDKLNDDEMKYAAVLDENGNLVNLSENSKDWDIIDAYLTNSLENINDNTEI